MELTECFGLFLVLHKKIESLILMLIGLGAADELVILVLLGLSLGLELLECLQGHTDRRDWLHGRDRNNGGEVFLH